MELRAKMGQGGAVGLLDFAEEDGEGRKEGCPGLIGGTDVTGQRLDHALQIAGNGQLEIKVNRVYFRTPVGVSGDVCPFTLESIRCG